MLTTILSLLGAGLGGAMRLMPEVFKLFTAKGDQAHEYKMTALQLEIDKARAAQGIDLVHAQRDAAISAGEMQARVEEAKGEMLAYIEAIKGQSAMTGVPWVDALNQSVRPVVTYWWMVLVSLYKLVMIVAASIEFYFVAKSLTSFEGLSVVITSFGKRIWTVQDAGILSMILGFWFVDRSLRKMNG